MNMFENNVIIIAECGVNHNGDVLLAKEMIDVAYEAGADFVKFQTYKVDALITKECPMATYQIENLNETKSQYQMLKAYELKEEEFHELFEYAQKRNIKFLSTPFDLESLNFLISLGLDTVKISSGDLTNALLLFESARNQLKLILSTGMSSLEEVRQSLALVHWAYFNKSDKQLHEEALKKYACKISYEDLFEKVSLLHCLSDYPAPVEHINLKAMKTMEAEFALNIGYSDHSLGTHIAVAAVAMGAKIIEKHFTLDRNLPGPDHKASLLPTELKQLVKEIRDTEKAMGDGLKVPRGNEFEVAQIVRKSLYAKKKISTGEIITKEDIICLRPMHRNSPMQYWDFLNEKSKQDYNPGDPL